jgi:hypothetical protein
MKKGADPVEADLKDRLYSLFYPGWRNVQCTVELERAFD